ncbi:MAG: hypothetical protein FJX72_00550 [Armatimonadetes bacterium]|nr:hypothetical protein [Armatimonadota bacterium]
MEAITVPAHYDGSSIRLDKPVALARGARLLVMVLPDGDAELSDWHGLSTQGLRAAYGDEEDDYPLNCVREANPAYGRR